MRCALGGPASLLGTPRAPRQLWDPNAVFSEKAETILPLTLFRVGVPCEFVDRCNGGL
jgi:hypothetical protein